MNTIIHKEILTLMLGVLFIGSAAVIVGMKRTANTIERTPGCVIHEPDGETFVYGAYA
ncbi:MAG: hypothetical protein WEB33_01370 [Bacteroidota bacterium]